MLLVWDLSRERYGWKPWFSFCAQTQGLLYVYMMQEQSYKAVLQVQKQMYSDKVVKIFPSSQNKSKCVVK